MRTSFVLFFMLLSLCFCSYFCFFSIRPESLVLHEVSARFVPRLEERGGRFLGETFAKYRFKLLGE